MSTLHMNNKTPINQVGNTAMKTQSNNTSAFDVKSFLALAQAIDGVDNKRDNKVACPEWLVIKNGLGCTTKNAFWVTAGIVKSTRQILDAINYTQKQLDIATDRLTMQELRAGRTSSEVFNYGMNASKSGITPTFLGVANTDVVEAYEEERDDDDHGSNYKVSGFNPDGYEYDEALEEAALLVEKLEAVMENGERILGEVVAWIDANAYNLELVVETGYTVKLGVIGNEVRTARKEPLTWRTLLVGIQLQREFIASNK